MPHFKEHMEAMFLTIANTTFKHLILHIMIQQLQYLRNIYKQIHIFKSLGKIVNKNYCFAIQRQAYLFLWQESTIERNNKLCNYETTVVKRLSCMALLNGFFCRQQNEVVLRCKSSGPKAICFHSTEIDLFLPQPPSSGVGSA